MKKVLVIGGGAAGMFAAISAAEEGHEVHLFEKNEKCGKKLYITGKGRCNLTNACEMEDLFNNVCSNSKFLYSSFYGFTNQDAALKYYVKSSTARYIKLVIPDGVGNGTVAAIRELDVRGTVIN